MPLGNTATRYGGVAKTFHWLTALLILTALPLGVIANGAPFETDAEIARKIWLFSLHKTVGVTAFFVALARIAWALTQPKPAALHPDRRFETRLAETVHWLLYASLVLVPLSGWLHHAAATGFAPIWWPFGQTLPFVPQSAAVANFFAGLHFVFTKVLAASVILHIAGALKHALVDKDATLRRMLPGTVAIPDTPPPQSSRTPILAAAALYLVALALGTLIGVQADRPPAPSDAPQTVQIAPRWTVETGTLEVAVMPQGGILSGGFGNWSADITFDPDAPGDRVGQVFVTVLVPSLGLGTVTAQALGPNFLDATLYPTAEFSAEILREDGAYAASGTLTVKGKSAPAT
ncbi:MAG: cytochrome b/b6 domain-containing protein, partial [Alphaproteobacteria bacterium]|nr:cytochrome b/b6 domain-containing protein [Alphaproteobacteria bacterium]